MVSQLPKIDKFNTSSNNFQEEIVMSVEEFETIRLIDYEGMRQEECANYMEVARTTVQTLYQDARKKIARMLVEGLPLSIKGGNYKLVNSPRCHRNCPKRMSK